MESLKQTGKKDRLFRMASLLLVALTVVSGVSCGPDVIKGRPPFVSISDMSQATDTLSAVFVLSNQNGVPMNIDAMEIAVLVNTTELTRYDSQSSLLIDANSTEEVRAQTVPDEFTRKLLTSLDSGQLQSLSFDLEGRVHTLEDGYLSFEQKGYLYPVPGRPGHFRAAVTQAKGLVREKPH